MRDLLVTLRAGNRYKHQNNSISASNFFYIIYENKKTNV